MTISIIVPVLDEAANLRPLLGNLRYCPPSSEIIVVDGGSQDGSVEIAGELADHVIASRPGRAVQMNIGAKAAHGDVLWFVHADSTVTPSLGPAIETILDDPEVVGGCFRLRLTSTKAIYRIRDSIGNFLVGVTGIALGDRGIFCRTDAFLAVGGYPDLSILEDAEFYRKLRSRGQVVQLQQSIGSSVRRYEALGPTRTMLFYAFVMLLYAVGIRIRKLERLVRWYMAGHAPGASRN
jgi:rSAM/selenodomain-associated transferase 2